MKMCGVQNLVFILCTILSCVTNAEEEIHVSGYEGREVNVCCPYGEGYQQHEKYLCKDACGKNDVLITTTEAKEGKYSVHDDKKKRVFTVTISDLSRTDVGIYWCGVTRTGFDTYPAKVQLEVVPEWCCVKSNKLSGIVGRRLTLQCLYPPQHRRNRKFLCKGDHRNNCTDMVASQSRFTLQDDVASSSFSLTIRELKAGDAGTYWCGSDSQWSVANYTKIQLSVVFPQQTSTVISAITVVEPVGPQSTRIPGKQIEDAAPFHSVVFIVPAVLLLLTCTLAIVFRYNCYKVRGAGASVNRNKTKAAKTEEVISVVDIYENQDVARSKQRSSKPQSTCQRYDAGETQQESVYQNYTTNDIYCNQTYIEAIRR